jgi:hypothetical protein
LLKASAPSVLFGCGAAVVSGKTLADTIMSGAPAGIGVLGIALAFGLAVVVLLWASGRGSGDPHMAGHAIGLTLYNLHTILVIGVFLVNSKNPLQYVMAKI